MKETKPEYDPNFPDKSSSVSSGRRGRPSGKLHHMRSERRRVNSGSICKMGRWICESSWETQMISRRTEENNVVVGDCTRSRNPGIFWALRKIVTWLLAKWNHPRQTRPQDERSRGLSCNSSMMSSTNSSGSCVDWIQPVAGANSIRETAGN
jgi:hypothetical protein